MAKPSNVLAPVFLLATCVLAGAQTASQPTTRPFTISKETTLMDGPLNADGTINYVQVINDRLSKGVTPENNAAIELLQAATTNQGREFSQRFLDALHIKLPADNQDALTDLFSFAAQKNGQPLAPEDEQNLETVRNLTRTAPWKAADQPLAAQWLEQSQNGLKLLESACEKPHCYIPWVGKSTPANWLDAMPPLSGYRSGADALVTRAMLHAGAGELKAALADLRRARTLAKFSTESCLDISLLIGDAIDVMALRGYEGLAASGTLTAADLAALRKELDAAAPLPSLLDAAPFEELLELDEIMMCARGDGGDAKRYMLLHAGIIDQNADINLGALPSADWDTMMITIHSEMTEARKIYALPFNERLRAYDARTKATVADDLPGGLLTDSGQRTGLIATEEFLEQRKGESRAAYSKRIANWLVAGSPDVDKRMDMVDQRARLERDIALLSITLAEFKLAHGDYPDSLQILGKPVLQDPFSGKDIIYRRQNKGYILYSVGLNEKDDNGGGDDKALKADK